MKSTCTTCGYFLYLLYLSICMPCASSYISLPSPTALFTYAKPSNLPPSFLLPCFPIRFLRRVVSAVILNRESDLPQDINDLINSSYGYNGVPARPVGSSLSVPSTPTPIPVHNRHVRRSGGAGNVATSGNSYSQYGSTSSNGSNMGARGSMQ